MEEEEKIYPGYILVDMIVTDDSWYVVRNTPRVTGFVGSGVYPVPVDKKEIDGLFKRMDSATVKHNIELYGGDVRAESELGKGARFILLFPARALIKLAKLK